MTPRRQGSGLHQDFAVAGLQFEPLPGVDETRHEAVDRDLVETVTVEGELPADTPRRVFEPHPSAAVRVPCAKSSAIIAGPAESGGVAAWAERKKASLRWGTRLSMRSRQQDSFQ